MREKMELTMHMEKNKLVNQIRTAIFKSEFRKKYLFLKKRGQINARNCKK